MLPTMILTQETKLLDVNEVYIGNAAGNFTATEVEGALAELAASNGRR